MRCLILLFVSIFDDSLCMAKRNKSKRYVHTHIQMFEYHFYCSKIIINYYRFIDKQ